MIVDQMPNTIESQPIPWATSANEVVAHDVLRANAE